MRSAAVSARARAKIATIPVLALLILPWMMGSCASTQMDPTQYDQSIQREHDEATRNIMDYR